MTPRQLYASTALDRLMDKMLDLHGNLPEAPLDVCMKAFAWADAMLEAEAASLTAKQQAAEAHLPPEDDIPF